MLWLMHYGHLILVPINAVCLLVSAHALRVMRHHGVNISLRIWVNGKNKKQED